MKQNTILKQYNLIKINPSPEIWLKSMKVRMRMVKTLTNNIKQRLKSSRITYHKFQLSKDSTRIFFFFNNEDIQDAMDLFEKVFGIDSFSPALRTSNNMKNIVQRTLEVCEDVLFKNDTFAIRVKRSGKHNYTSQDVAKKVGQAILDNFPGLNLKVNLSNPMRTVFIEIRGEFSYIFTEIIKSKWEGLPIESKKKILCMDIGRLNDILAGFLLMRRGCEISPILFKLTNENSNIEKWKKNWKEVKEFSPYLKFKLKIINLLEILGRIQDSLKEKKYLCAICRLLRFEILSKLLKESKIEDFESIKAISDGTSLNNSTLCTDIVDLESLSKNYMFSEYPIFTALIGLDAKEIKDIITKISRTLSHLDYCSFKPQNQEIDCDILMKLYKSLNIKNMISEVLENIEEKNIP